MNRFNKFTPAIDPRNISILRSARLYRFLHIQVKASISFPLNSIAINFFLRQARTKQADWKGAGKVRHMPPNSTG